MDYESLKSTKLFVFDMDGTIFLGGKPFPEAIDFINYLRETGRKFLFFTNNASTNKDFLIDKLTKMGFGPSKSEIMSSADVTIKFLNLHRRGKKIYLLGTELLKKQFADGGIEFSDDAEITVTSFDTSLTYEKLTKTCTLIRNGSEFLCTHPDFNCPTEDGFLPDSGAIAAAVTAATNVLPTYFGKPYRATLEMISEYMGVEPEKICFIGDRLYTDIAVSKSIPEHPALSILVMTGETTPEMAERAQGSEKPDFIFENLAELKKVMND